MMEEISANHRVRAVQELHGLMAEAVEELNSQVPDEDMPEPAMNVAEAEAVVRAWCMAAAAVVGEVETPTSIKQALGGPQSKEWRTAMDEEWVAMKALRVWDPQPVPLPPGKTAVDGKFVFAPKLDAQGKVARYRARFVARGFTQRAGSDYTETFSSVVKWATIRMVAALAAVNDWEIHVVDVKTAFLRAPLEEEVYLRQPPQLSDGTDRVLRFRQALYGLKKSPGAWEQEQGKFLVGQGFKRCVSDRALYVKAVPGEW